VAVVPGELGGTSVVGETARVGGEEVTLLRESPSRRFGFATGFIARVDGMGRLWVVSWRTSSSCSSKLRV